jgi:hypothetical protein
MLLLKIVLVPSLIAAVTLATRRWGPRVGGFLTALPVVTGPTLCFYAVEQGRAFGARAATGTLIALAAVVAYGVVYARLSARWTWPATLVCGWAAFLLTTTLLYFIPQNPIVGLVLVTVVCLVGARLLPATGVVGESVAHPAWDIPLRMSAAVVLVLVLTSVAGWLGPSLSGLLTPFPLATAILAAFTHAQRGRGAVVAFFAGFIPALVTFAVFCFVLAVTLTAIPLALAITSALVAQVLLQALLYRRQRDALLVASS